MNLIEADPEKSCVPACHYPPRKVTAPLRSGCPKSHIHTSHHPKYLHMFIN